MNLDALVVCFLLAAVCVFTMTAIEFVVLLFRLKWKGKPMNPIVRNILIMLVACSVAAVFYALNQDVLQSIIIGSSVIVAALVYLWLESKSSSVGITKRTPSPRSEPNRNM